MGIWKSEERKRKDVGSEILLYSERCIVQKLLAGGFPWKSTGFHELRCPSNSLSAPLLERTRCFQLGLVDTSCLYKLQDTV
jgi:hypothetical protein